MLGLYNAPFETTRQTRGARAMQTLLKLAQETALAKSVATFWPKILTALSDNEFDFPFAILYSVADDEEDGVSQSSENSQSFKSCFLEGTLGVCLFSWKISIPSTLVGMSEIDWDMQG